MANRINVAVVTFVVGVTSALTCVAVSTSLLVGLQIDRSNDRAILASAGSRSELASDNSAQNGNGGAYAAPQQSRVIPAPSAGSTGQKPLPENKVESVAPAPAPVVQAPVRPAPAPVPAPRPVPIPEPEPEPAPVEPVEPEVTDPDAPVEWDVEQLNAEIDTIMSPQADRAARINALEHGAQIIMPVDAASRLVEIYGPNSGFDFYVAGPVSVAGDRLDATLVMTMAGSPDRTVPIHWVWGDRRWRLSRDSMCTVLSRYGAPCG